MTNMSTRWHNFILKTCLSHFFLDCLTDFSKLEIEVFYFSAWTHAKLLILVK